MTVECANGVEGLRRHAKAGLEAFEEGFQAFGKVAERCRWLRRARPEDVARVAEAVVRVVEVREPLEQALEPYRNALRAHSTGPSALHGFRAASAAEAIAKATAVLRGVDPEVLSRLPERIAEFFASEGRWKLAKIAWKYTFAILPSNNTDIEGCLDIELARLEYQGIGSGSTKQGELGELTEPEKAVVEAVKVHGPLEAKHLAPKLHKSYSGSLRGMLNSLVQRRVLTKDGRKYAAE